MAVKHRNKQHQGQKQNCPYCKQSIETGQMTECPDCKTSLHQECWDTHNGCTTLGCKSASINHAVKAFNTGDVSFDEDIALRIAQWLRRNGFVPADGDGTEIRSVTRVRKLDILYADPKVVYEPTWRPTPHGWLYNFIAEADELERQKRADQEQIRRSVPRRIDVGQLDFSASDKEALWRLSVYGRDAQILELAKSLASGLSEAFGVKVSCTVVSESRYSERR